MRVQPFTHKKTLFFFILLASLVGISIDYSMGTRVDYWLHDSAVVFQQRQEWKYTAIVVLDDEVPFRVTRIQALPLFARAIEHLIAQGAKGVFLDARVSKEMEGRMPYAVCLKTNGQVLWSQPKCQIDTHKSQCSLVNSVAGNAPLKMNVHAIKRFKIAPYLNNSAHLPDFLLYDWDAAEAIPATGLEVKDRLVTKSTPIARWLDMSDDHAIFRLIQLLAPDKIAALYQKNRLDESCNDNRRCRRLRLSEPIYTTHFNGGRLILPLSQLASCDESIANKAAALLKNKLVVLQASSPNESTDIMVTPMTVALFGPQLITPGAQYIVDEIETVLNQDYPRPPVLFIRIILFVCIAMLSVLLGAYFSQTLVWFSSILIFFTFATLCFVNPLTQLWPVTAVMATYLTGAIQTVAIHFILGIRQGSLLSQYVPKQILELLIPLSEDESFQHRHCQVVVLMSDLAGYTTVTGLLKEPEHVMNLMNDYLSATSIVLQDKYDGVLEAYVGDLVCYYWEYNENSLELAYKNALCGATELALLQKNFFSSVASRYKGVLTPEVIEKISTIINAGIGVTAGTVVKGNLGPRRGVQKFCILGDPLNLASRIESLTRLFNTEIIIVGDFFNTIAKEGLVARRLGAIKVKGRVEPAVLYALGLSNDPRFAATAVKEWELWTAEIEAGLNPHRHCPDIYTKDRQTILDWRERGILDENGVWLLHEK